MEPSAECVFRDRVHRIVVSLPEQRIQRSGGEEQGQLDKRGKKGRHRALACGRHGQAPRLQQEMRTADKRAEPHDQAAVTVLTPLVKTITDQAQTLATLLIHYQGVSRRPADSAERRESDHFRSSWSDDGQRHRCNWCGLVEPDKWRQHYPLDRDPRDWGEAIRKGITCDLLARHTTDQTSTQIS